MNLSPLKAMFWKECRENVRWAVLACLALSFGLAYAWSRLPSGPALPQVWSGENLVLTITTPLIGLALGLLQILPELRRDQWAFLVHRPASRTTLFFGKILPGVCLYLAATALPLLGLAVWAASPSRVPAPFDFRFTLAGWAAILAGLPFYFAGLLAALRPARWYGSRALPVLTALLAPCAAATFYEFWATALVSLAVAAVLGAAAWGSFLTAGEYREQTKPARSALGLALYPAVLALGVGALMLSIAAYGALGGRALGAGDGWSTGYKIDTQGRLFVVSEHFDGRGHSDKTVADLSGHAVEPRLWQNLNQQHTLLDLSYLFLKNPATDRSLRYSDASRYVLYLSSYYSEQIKGYWYYETASRQIVHHTANLEGISVDGYLGPNGFHQSREQAGRFEGALPSEEQVAGLGLLRFPRSLYWYRLSPPAIGLLQAARGIGGMRGVTSLGRADDRENDSHAGLAVAADGDVTIYAPAAAPGGLPRRLFTTPVAFNYPSQDGVQIAVTPDRTRFFFWYESWKGANRLLTVDAVGRLLKTEALPAPGAAYFALARKSTPFLNYSLFLAIPPGAVLGAEAYAGSRPFLGWSPAEGFSASPSDVFPILFFCVFGGLVAAALAWLISRRLGDGRRGRLAWAFGAFWLGGYGVLLLLALRAWPARLPCPDCGRQRVVDNEACEHCGAAWARPRRDGTEIFDAEGRAKEPTPLATPIKS